MNYTKILALVSGALLWMSSCTSSSDLNQLPEAAIRTQQALSATVSTLEGHEGYWRLTYYPDAKRAYGGYAMYVQFKDGRVKAISELSTEETNSTYAVKNIDMPTLAFDTRSDILHHFITSTEYFRNARGGDFELLLMGQRGDSILLQGRKYRNLMSLVPIKGDPRQEITSIQQTTAKLQGKGLSPVTIGSAGTPTDSSSSSSPQAMTRKRPSSKKPSATLLRACSSTSRSPSGALRSRASVSAVTPSNSPPSRAM